MQLTMVRWNPMGLFQGTSCGGVAAGGDDAMSLRPYCGSSEVFKSRRGNARIILPLRLFVVCVRCYDCGKRFFRRGVLAGGKRIPAPPEAGASRDAPSGKPDQ